MIADSVAFLRERGQARRSTTPSTSSTPTARTPPTRSAACARRPRRAPRTSTLCDTNGSSLPGQVAEATAAVVAELGGGVQVGIHTHDDAGCGVANALVAVEAGARLRCRGRSTATASAAATPTSSRSSRRSSSSSGYECVAAGAARARSRRPRTSSTRSATSRRTRTSPTSGRTRSPTRAACTWPASRATRAPSSTSTRPWSATTGGLLISELVRQGHGRGARRAERRRARRRRRHARRRARQGARAPGLPVRGGRRLVRPPDPRETGDYEPLFRLESWRVIVEKREDGRVETEATIKIWVDGERYVRTAEGNGPVHALDRRCAPRSASSTRTCATSSSSTSRSASSTRRRAPARSRACCSTPATAIDTWGSIGVSENVIEASWEALVDSLEAGMLPGRASTAAASARERAPADESDPARAARDRRARGGARARGAALGAAVARRGSAEFERRLRGSGRRRARRGGVERDRRAAPRHPRRRDRSRATRSSRRRSASSRRPTASSTRARGRCSATSTRRTLNIDPDGGRGGRHRAHDRAAAGPHLRLPGRHAGARGARRRARPVDRRGRLRGARRRARRRRAGRRARQPRGVRLLPEQADHDGRGRHGRLPPTPATRQRIDSERNQGRAPDMGWLDHDRLGFNYRLVDLACALGVAQLERLDELLERRARAVAGCYAEALAGHRGARAARARTRAATAAAGSSTSCSCREGSTATPRSRRCASAASTRSPTSRRST